MTVELLVVPGCPQAAVARARLGEALERLGRGGAVTEVVVRTPARAEELGFVGSPAFVVDGRDLFAPPGAPAGLACRRYPGTADGVPSVEELLAALARR